jgi:DNA primase
MDSQIEKIRSSVSLFDVWRDLELPGTPRIGDLRSPFRDDKRASFTIYQAKGHLRFHDHGSGEGGDCIDLWVRAKGITVKEAIAQMTGGAHTPAKAPNRR